MKLTNKQACGCINMDELTTLNGKITYILFRNDSNFYTVAKFLVNDESEHTITITGIFPDIEEDVLYNVHGFYVEHPKYGVQFKVETIDRPLPSEREGIIRYLSSSKFPGIGKKIAEKIVETLGEECLAEIKENPDCLLRVERLTKKHYESIVNGIHEDDDGLQELVSFMNIHGIGMRNLIRINQKYGKEALKKLQENPYRVVEELDGFGFATADKIGSSLGFEKDDPRRLHAYMIALCENLCMKSGDSYVSLGELKDSFLIKTKGYEVDFDSTLESCILSRALVNDNDCIYTKAQFDSEKYIAHFLSDYPYKQLEQYNIDLFDTYLRNIQTGLGITYDELQIDAITTLFNEPFSILTGGPGTGKTTVVRAMVTLLKMLYPNCNIACCAPTGRAAKRISEICEIESSTIHSLLEWNLESNEFKKNEKEPLTYDVLIIDEFSMVDSYLFSNLLKASRNVKKICIIGDEEQLPSVSCGSVLRDLIESDCFPSVRLKHIYRQKEGSGVIDLSKDILESNIHLDKYQEDIQFFESDSVMVKDTIIQIVKSSMQANYDIEDIQVLSPMYNGNAGIHVLNKALQEAFNPSSEEKNEVKLGFVTFREGDKVLQLKNQPDDEVFNGDIGRIVEIIPSNMSEDKRTSIIVDFDSNYVEYKPDDFSNITLAYCISVHKSQGSEYPIVIIPFTYQHSFMLNRKLIYTAITRCKKSLFMVGDKNVFMNGCSLEEKHFRKTKLKERIIQSLKHDF